jgi:hypothetical protein
MGMCFSGRALVGKGRSILPDSFQFELSIWCCPCPSFSSHPITHISINPRPFSLSQSSRRTWWHDHSLVCASSQLYCHSYHWSWDGVLIMIMTARCANITPKTQWTAVTRRRQYSSMWWAPIRSSSLCSLVYHSLLSLLALLTDHSDCFIAKQYWLVPSF